MRTFFENILVGGGVFFDLFKWFIFILVLITLCNRFLISPFIVDGVSMEPTMENRELAILNKYSYNSKSPERGDVVVVKYPGDPEQKKYVKRVIGLPGEKISFAEGKVFIDDKALDESYLEFGVVTDPDKKNTYNLDNNNFFLMGDNRLRSNDSRYFGPVEQRFIMGKVSIVLFPKLRQILQAEY